MNRSRLLLIVAVVILTAAIMFGVIELLRAMAIATHLD